MSDFFGLSFGDDPDIPIAHRKPRKNKKRPNPRKLRARMQEEAKQSTANSSNNLEMKISPESDLGDREYKLRLINLSNDRLEGLMSQMHFRLGEGQGTAYYMIGFDDDGNIIGLTTPQLEESLRTIQRMTEKIRAGVECIKRAPAGLGEVAEVTIQWKKRESLMQDIKVVFLGCADSGKSSLISVLANGLLDNGKGIARSRVSKHKHELFSGTTSSISHHVLGFDNEGRCTNHSHGSRNSHEYIVDHSAKLLTLIDLAGSEKYAKKVVSGLCTQYSDYAIIVHDASKPFDNVTIQHMQLCWHFQFPMIVVFTKTDLATQQETLRSRNHLDYILKGRLNIEINNASDVQLCSQHFLREKIIPLFSVSCVSGEGLELLTQFLHLLPSSTDWEDPTNTLFQVEKCLGRDQQILCGVLVRGTITTGQNLLLGPDEAGGYSEVQVDSIHCKEIPVQSVKARHFCSFRLVEPVNMRPGMVMLDVNSEPRAALEFECELILTTEDGGEKVMKSTYQPCVYLHMIRQSTKLMTEEPPKVQPGTPFTLRLRFLHYAVYIVPGMKLMVKDTFMTAIGTVKSVDFLSEIIEDSGSY